jgi:hypothetical protein
MNLEIDKKMNSTQAEFGPRLGTASPAQRPKWPGRGVRRRRLHGGRGRRVGLGGGSGSVGRLLWDGPM